MNDGGNYLRVSWELLKHEPFALADMVPAMARALVELLVAGAALIVCFVIPAPWGGLIGAIPLSAFILDQGLRRAAKRHRDESQGALS